MIGLKSARYIKRHSTQPISITDTTRPTVNTNLIIYVTTQCQRQLEQDTLITIFFILFYSLFITRHFFFHYTVALLFSLGSRSLFLSFIIYLEFVVSNLETLISFG